MTRFATPEPQPTFRPEFNEDSVRTRILRVGARLISEHGIAGMSMRQLAAEAGYSTGTINYHFQNKRKLSIAVLEYVYRLPTGWSRDDSTPVNLSKLLASFVLENEGRRTWWKFWMRYGAEATTDEELRRHQVTRMERQEDFYARTIAEAVERGELRPDQSPREAARTLLALAHGLAVTQVIDGGTESVERARVVMDAALDSILHPVEMATG